MFIRPVSQVQSYSILGLTRDIYTSNYNNDSYEYKKTQWVRDETLNRVVLTILGSYVRISTSIYSYLLAVNSANVIKNVGRVGPESFADNAQNQGCQLG